MVKKLKQERLNKPMLQRFLRRLVCNSKPLFLIGITEWLAVFNVLFSYVYVALADTNQIDLYCSSLASNFAAVAIAPLLNKMLQRVCRDKNNICCFYPQHSSRVRFPLLFFVGASNGNRTRILSLGSSHSTIELYSHFDANFCLYYPLFFYLQAYFSLLVIFFMLFPVPVCV